MVMAENAPRRDGRLVYSGFGAILPRLLSLCPVANRVLP